MNSWVDDFLSKLSNWARAEGCDRLSASGRRGWSPLAINLGWQPVGEESGNTIFEVAL